MELLLAFGFGCVAGSLVTQHWAWVRGVAGKARDAVLGSRPAAIRKSRRTEPAIRDSRIAEPDIQPDISAANETVRPAISFATAARNVTGFAIGLLSWCARNPIVAIGLVILALWLVMGAPFGFGKSKGQLRLEREIAEANARVAEFEARIGELSRDLAVNTERDRTRRNQIITQAQREIEDATAQVDPDAQYAAYVRGYLCLLDAGACESGANPDPAGADPVRSPSADAA